MLSAYNVTSSALGALQAFSFNSSTYKTDIDTSLSYRKVSEHYSKVLEMNVTKRKKKENNLGFNLFFKQNTQSA